MKTETPDDMTPEHAMDLARKSIQAAIADTPTDHPDYEKCTKALGVFDLSILIESKKSDARALRSEIKALTEEIKRLKKTNADRRSHNEIKESASKFSGAWADLIESGMKEREVVALQNINAKLRPLGEILGVSASYARQIRATAMRKMRWPQRRDLAHRIGLTEALKKEEDGWEARRSIPESGSGVVTYAETWAPYHEDDLPTKKVDGSHQSP